MLGESLPDRVDLQALLSPKSIAILGASGRAGNPYARPLQYLVEFGYAGAVYPVNPRYQTLAGVRSYPSLDDLPGPVDLVLMLVAADEAIRQIPAVARAGARVAVVFASGFAEAGESGRQRQADLLAVAREHQVRIVGPNSQGLLSTHDRVIASFSAALDLGRPLSGNVAYVGQSGAVGGSILSLARERGLGIAAWVSTGNQADLGAVEIATHLIEDSRIAVIAMYLESTVDGLEFDRLTRRAGELGKSVLILQSARSSAGARAAASHTGAIIGSNAAFDAMCRARAVIQADDVEDFIALAHALSVLPRGAGPRVGIVSTSGGAASLAADQAEAAGLVVESFSLETQRKLSRRVPDFGAIANPVDATAEIFKHGRGDQFVELAAIVLDDPAVDCVFVVITMVAGELAAAVATDLRDVWTRSAKPLLVVWLAARQQTSHAREILREAGLPVLDSPRTAMRVLHALRATPEPEAGPTPAADPALVAMLDELPAGVVTERGAQPLLARAGVARPEQVLVRSAAEAKELARTLDGSLVVKIASTAVLHKTERGGVVIGVRPDELADAYTEMCARFTAERATEVLVQQLVAPGPELLVGLTNLSEGFPPLLTVGVGGVTTEIYQDVSTRLAPVDAPTARQMLLELRGAALFTGFRGGPAYRLDRAAASIAALSRIAVATGPRLVELEVNPLRLIDGGGSAVALDFMMRLRARDSQSIDSTPTEERPA